MVVKTQKVHVFGIAASRSKTKLPFFEKESIKENTMMGWTKPLHVFHFYLIPDNVLFVLFAL